VVFGGALYVAAQVNDGVEKLFRTDGMSLTQVADIRGGTTLNDAPYGYAEYDGALYFGALTTSSTAKLFRIGGTDVEQVSDILGAAGNDGPGDLQVAGSYLYFTANAQGTNRKLYRTDGTTIVQVSDTNPGGNDDPYPLAELGNELYFTAWLTAGGDKLFRTDGSSVTQVSNTSNDEGVRDFFWGSSPPTVGAVYNGSLYLQARPAAGTWSGTKLYRTDGVTMTRFSGITADDTTEDEPRPIRVYGGKLYFSAYDAAGNAKVFCTDGSSIVQVSNTSADFDLATGIIADFQTGTVLNDALYLALRDASDNYSLHRLCDPDAGCTP
jgi:ELWxxDGT repeat protein